MDVSILVIDLPGDYNVKISFSEIEVKFLTGSVFYAFKRRLLALYPTVPWSKFLQRDCATLTLDSKKTVTLHLWEEIHSIWISGQGKMEFYNREFQEIVSAKDSKLGMESSRQTAWKY